MPIKIYGKLVGLNRGRLALMIYYGENRTSMCVPFKDLQIKDKYYHIADHIIAHEGEIIEVRNG